MSKIILIFRILLKKTIGTFLQTLKVGFLSKTFFYFFIFILSRDEFSNISPGGHWFSPPFVLSFYLLQLLWNWFSPRLSALCSQTGQPQLNILIDYENSFSKKLWQSRILNRKGYAYNIYSFFVLDSDYAEVSWGKGGSERLREVWINNSEDCASVQYPVSGPILCIQGARSN